MQQVYQTAFLSISICSSSFDIQSNYLCFCQLSRPDVVLVVHFSVSVNNLVFTLLIKLHNVMPGFMKSLLIWPHKKKEAMFLSSTMELLSIV